MITKLLFFGATICGLTLTVFSHDLQSQLAGAGILLTVICGQTFNLPS